eukprot:scaffold6164_cov163-Amphora_coffeaeformis.AAC.7
MTTTTATTIHPARASSTLLGRNSGRNGNSNSNPRRRNATATTTVRKTWKRREFPENAALQPIRKPGTSTHRHASADTSNASSSSHHNTKKQQSLLLVSTKSQSKYKISESRKVAAWEQSRFTWTLTVDTPGGHAPWIAIVRGVELMEEENSEEEQERQEEEDVSMEEEEEHHHQQHISASLHTLKVGHRAGAVGQKLLGTTALENSMASLEADFIVHPENLLLHSNSPQQHRKETDNDDAGDGNGWEDEETDSDYYDIPALPRPTALQVQHQQSKDEDSSSVSESAVDCEEESCWEESKSLMTTDEISLQEFYHQDSIRKERRVDKGWKNAKHRQEKEEEADEEEDFDEDEANDHYDDEGSLPDIAACSPRAKQQSFDLPPSPQHSRASLEDVSEAAEIDVDDSAALRMNDLLDILPSQHGNSDDPFEDDGEEDDDDQDHHKYIAISMGSDPSLQPPRRPVRTLSQRPETTKSPPQQPKRQISTTGTDLPPTFMPMPQSKPVPLLLPVHLQPERQVIIVERGQQQAQRSVKATPSTLSRFSAHTEGDSTLENSFVLPESDLCDQRWANNEEDDSGFSSGSSSSSSSDSMDDSEMDDESEKVRRYVEEMEMTKVDKKDIISMDESADEESIMEYYQRDRVTTMLLALQNKKGGNDDDDDESTLLTPELKSKPKTRLPTALRTNSQYSHGLYGGCKEGFEVDLDPNDSVYDESLTFLGSFHQDDPVVAEEQSSDSLTLSMGSELESPAQTISTIANSEAMLQQLGDSMPSIDEYPLWADRSNVSRPFNSIQEKWLATVQETVVKREPGQTTAPDGKPKKPHRSVSMDSTDQRIHEEMKKDDGGLKIPTRCMSMNSTQRHEVAVRGAVVAMAARKGASKQTPPPSKAPKVTPTSTRKRNNKRPQSGKISKVPDSKESSRLQRPGNRPVNPPQLKGNGPVNSARPPQTPTVRTRNSIVNQAGGTKSKQQGDTGIKTPSQRRKSAVCAKTTPQPQNSIEQLEALTRTPSQHAPLTFPMKKSPAGRLRAPSVLSADVSTIPSPYQNRSEVPEICSDPQQSPEFVQLSLDDEDGVRRVTNANVMDVEMPDLDEIREQEIVEKIERSKARERRKKGNLLGGRRKATEKKQAKPQIDPTGRQFLDNLWSFGTNASFSDMAAKNMSDMSAYIEPSGLR